MAGRVVCFANTANRELFQIACPALPLDARHSSVKVSIESAGEFCDTVSLLSRPFRVDGWNAGLSWRAGRRRARLTDGYRCLPMVHKTMRQNGKSPLIAQLTTKGILAEGFGVLTSRHLIAVLLTSSVAITAAIAVFGPMGFHHRESPLERVALALLYMALIWPVVYGQFVVVYYFLRRRSPTEILAVLVVAMLPISFLGSAVVHTGEGLTHPGYAADSGFVRVFLLFAVVSAACALLCFYLVWQRVGAGHVTKEDRQDNDPAAESERSTEAAKSAHSRAESPPSQPVADANGTPAEVVVAAGSGTETEPAAEPASAAAGGTTAAVQIPGPRQLVPYQPANRPRELFRLLPDRLGTDLVFIKSEDHYLEVHTTAGSSLIKMRFSDAIAELGDRGIKVHRSYWVATGHVLRAGRSGKRTVLRLTGDHRVPVSVTHLRAVRAILPG